MRRSIFVFDKFKLLFREYYKFCWDRKKCIIRGQVSFNYIFLVTRLYNIFKLSYNMRDFFVFDLKFYSFSVFDLFDSVISYSRSLCVSTYNLLSLFEFNERIQGWGLLLLSVFCGGRAFEFEYFIDLVSQVCFGLSDCIVGLRWFFFKVFVVLFFVF